MVEETLEVILHFVPPHTTFGMLLDFHIQVYPFILTILEHTIWTLNRMSTLCFCEIPYA